MKKHWSRQDRGEERLEGIVIDRGNQAGDLTAEHKTKFLNSKQEALESQGGAQAFKQS